MGLDFNLINPEDERSLPSGRAHQATDRVNLMERIRERKLSRHLRRCNVKIANGMTNSPCQ